MLHLRILVSVVATTTFCAMWWAHRRRGQAKIEGPVRPFHVVAVLVMWLLMHIYVMLIYFLPALLLLYVPWSIASTSPLVQADLAESEAISEVGVLLSIGANFADVASTYRHRGFWAHIGQFALVLVPVYYGIVAAVCVIIQLLVQDAAKLNTATAGALRLFVPTVLAPQPWLDALLIATLLFAIGAVSYALRVRRAKREGYLVGHNPTSE